MCKIYSLLVSNYLWKQFYERNYTISQRSLILKTVQQAGKQLSEINQMPTKVQTELKALDNDVDESDSDGDSGDDRSYTRLLTNA